MRLDIRLPLGLLFVLVGLLLAGYGLASDPAIYQRSLHININLWWGAVLLVFGLVMFWLGRRGHRRPAALEASAASRGEGTSSENELQRR
jgi:hypothetical protein